ELFSEWWRRAAVFKPILITMPRAGYAAVYDAAFAERAVLMGAQIGQSTDVFAIAKDRDALTAGWRDDTRALVGDRLRRSDRDPPLAANGDAPVGRRFARPCHEMQQHNRAKSADQHDGQKRSAFELHHAEGDMHDHQPVGHVECHVETLPHRR